nr:immunoglobulin heavy chain junction region [Mus musculus]
QESTITMLWTTGV